MSDSVVKLRIDSKEYDANIRRAGQVLTDYFNKVREGGGTLIHLDEGVLEAVQAMGQMGTQCSTTRGVLRELTQATTDMTAAYRSLTEEEKNSPLGAAMSQAIDQMTQRAGDARDAMADVSAAINNAASDTRGFDQMAQGIGVATASFQGLTGACQLLGVNMGDNVAVIAKLQAAMAVTNSLTTIQNALQKQSALMQGVLAVQTRAAAAAAQLQGSSLKVATAAQAAFNVVAKANPYVMLATAILTVVATLSTFGSKAEDTTGPLEDLSHAADDAEVAIKRIGEDVDFDVAVGEAVGRAKGYLRELKLEAAKAKLGAALKVANEFNETPEEEPDLFGHIARGAKYAWHGVKSTLGMDTSSDTFETDKHKEERLRIQKMVDDAQAEVDAAEKAIDQAAEKLGIAVSMAFDDLTSKSVSEIRGAIARLDQEINDLPQNNPMREYYIETRDKLKAGLPEKESTSTRGSGTSGNRTTPQEKAASGIQQSEQKYQDAVSLAAKQFEAGTISEVEYKKQLLSQQQRLYDAYGTAYQTYADPKYKEAQTKAADEIVRLGGEVKSATEAQEAASKAARELERVDKELGDATTEMVRAIGENDLKGFYSAQKKVRAAGVPDNSSSDFTYTTGNADAFIGNLKEKISQSDVGSDLYNALTKQLADASTLGSLMEVAVKNGIDTAQLNPQELWGKIFSENPGDYIDDSTWQNLVDTINEKLKEMKVDPIKLDFNTGGVRQEAKKMSTDWQQAASAIQSVGQAMSSIEDPTAKVMGTIAQAIASIALGAGQAIAQAGTGSAGGPWGWIAFAAAATATMISTIASVKSATSGSYEHGGIVPGNSWHGDNLTANVNSGELILSRAQQNNLASQLQGGGMSGMHLSATVRGEDIRLALNNNSRRRGYGEYVTSNFR